MPHRDFDAARSERIRETEPVEFTLGGRRFVCVVDPTLGDALALAAAPERDQNPTEALRAILAFVRSLVVPGQRRAFDRVAKRTKDRRGRPTVASEEVWELAAWLVTTYTARPTSPPDGSSPSRRSPGEGSNKPGSTDTAAASPASP